MKRPAAGPHAVAAALGLVLLAPFEAFRHADWHTVYLPAARALLAGQDVYAVRPDFTYPPASMLLGLPFVAWPGWAAGLAWYVICAGATWVLWGEAWVAAGGDPGARARRLSREEQWVAAAGLLCALRFVLDAFGNQQSDLVVGALALAGAAALVRGREGRAGALLGAAAALKATPLLLAAVLVLRRRWLGLLWAMAMGGALTLAPDLVARGPHGGTWAGEWLARIARPAVDGTRETGAWFTAPSFNHSLSGLVHRLSAYDPPARPESLADQRRAAPRLGAAAGRRLTLALLAALALATLGAAAVAARHPPPATPAELGALVAAMLLLSPASSKPHFVVLVLPAFVLARHARAGDRRAACLLTTAVLLLVGSLPALFGSAGQGLRWWGAITAATGALWLGCVALCLPPAGPPGDAHPHQPGGSLGQGKAALPGPPTPLLR